MLRLENGYYVDGTEYIIFKNNGQTVVKEYDGDDEGEIVCVGSYDKCRDYINKRYAEIAASRVW